MKARNVSEPRWSVPIAADDIPETGRRIELVPDPATREAIARALGVAGLSRLEASFDLTRQGDEGLMVVGRVSATVEQICVVTLEPIENAIDEAVNLLFLPQPQLPPGVAEGPLSIQAEEPPEALRDGLVDLGAVAIEFLILGIDPYPRKPGALFDAPAPVDDPAAHPFAALAALKKRQG
jgi:Large ribosomal RNA subunit accumulation protein YceD